MKLVARNVKRIFITVIGITVILIALALLVLPGPGLLVLIIGLAILATEYEFARHWLKKAKTTYENGKNTITGKSKS